MNPKVLFVVVLLLIVLGAVFLAVGPTRDDRARTKLVPDWADSLSLNRTLAPGDVAGPERCLQLWQEAGLALPAGENCLLVVQEAEGFLPRVRVFTLRLEEGTAARVRLAPREKNRLSVDETLDAGDREVSLQVEPSGGGLEITCGPVDACRITLR